MIEQAGVAGISTNVNIECSLGRQEAAPFWQINGTVYELFSISCAFFFGVIPVVNSYSSLTIPRLTVELNGTDFQCIVFSEDRVIYATKTRLRVFPSELVEHTNNAVCMSSQDMFAEGEKTKSAQGVS